MVKNKYHAEKEWTKFYRNTAMMYPSEYVIRIFKGKYPRLNLLTKPYKNKKICDLGCGEGRNVPLLLGCGFDVYATEITQDIVNNVKTNLNKLGFKNITLKVGFNDNLPFRDNYFDFLLSWNVCYYMGKHKDFGKFVKEYARVLKKDGYLILSIPKKTSFIYKGSVKRGREYRIIKQDPFNIRNGEILRVFQDKYDIEKTFSSYFYRFVFASIHDDCFGYNYHWHIVVCQKN